MQNVEGNLGAMEEKEVYEEPDKIVVVIERARWIYTKEEVRKLILKEKEKIKRMLES